MSNPRLADRLAAESSCLGGSGRPIIGSNYAQLGWFLSMNFAPALRSDSWDASFSDNDLFSFFLKTWSATICSYQNWAHPLKQCPSTEATAQVMIEEIFQNTQDASDATSWCLTVNSCLFYCWVGNMVKYHCYCIVSESWVDHEIYEATHISPISELKSIWNCHFTHFMNHGLVSCQFHGFFVSPFGWYFLIAVKDRQFQWLVTEVYRCIAFV